MDHVLWLARIFGPFLFIAGLLVTLRTADVERVWAEFKANPVVMYFTGAVNLLIGLGILSTYSSWTFSLPVLLTILGWVLVLRGILVWFAPEKALELAEMAAAKLKLWGIVSLVWGFLICLYAFA